MKNLKKISAIIVALMMMATVFTACGSKEETKGTTETTVETTATEETTDTTSETTATTSATAATTTADSDDEYVEEDGTTDASYYVGDYYSSGETDVVMTISEDHTFTMTTTSDEMSNVITGTYDFGVTASADVISLKIYPQYSSTTVNGETTESSMDEVEPGVAIIEDYTLTLTLDDQETVFSKG